MTLAAIDISVSFNTAIRQVVVHLFNDRLCESSSSHSQRLVHRYVIIH